MLLLMGEPYGFHFGVRQRWQEQSGQMAMIAMTTSSSISVNPPQWVGRFLCFIMLGKSVKHRGLA
jgi:hypothetical protein